MFPLPSPPSLIVYTMHIEHKWPGKCNDTSGTQKRASTHGRWCLRKKLKVLSSSIHRVVGRESIHNVDSINTALLGIVMYKKCYYRWVPP